MNEPIWKDVTGYEGLYQVSDFGHVRRLPGVITRSIKGKDFQQRVPGGLLRPSKAAGYPAVNLCKGGVATLCYVHCIVAAAFIGPRPEGYQVAHEDGNKTNSRADNLRYDTPTGNADDRHAHETDAVGVNNPAATFTEEEIVEVKTMLITKSVKEVADELKRPRQTISGIASGRNWAHITIEGYDPHPAIKAEVSV